MMVRYGRVPFNNQRRPKQWSDCASGDCRKQACSVCKHGLCHGHCVLNPYLCGARAHDIATRGEFDQVWTHNWDEFVPRFRDVFSAVMISLEFLDMVSPAVLSRRNQLNDRGGM